MSANASSAAPSAERLRSVDALRGFDILWIVGGREVVEAWANSSDSSLAKAILAQLEHAPWHGFTAWDLIFPLFLFLAGVSTALSFEKHLAAGTSRASLGLRALRRAATLVFLGLVYNGLLAFDWKTLRCASVLGRIGLAWLFAAWIFLGAGRRARALWVIALLVGYWALLEWVPVPWFGAGNLEPGATLTDWIDRHFLPGRLHRGVRDPEGLLSTLPAIATALLGIFAGEWLGDRTRTTRVKLAGLLALGVALLGLGALWNLEFPINKNLWTSSFVCWTAGFSALLLALAHLVVDVWRFERLGWFFAVVGSNSILIYLAARFVDFRGLTIAIVGNEFALAHPLWVAVLPLAIEWSALWILWRRKLFLRV